MSAQHKGSRAASRRGRSFCAVAAGLGLVLGLLLGLTLAAAPVRAQSPGPDPQLDARLRRDEAELLHHKLELRGLRRLVGTAWQPAEAPFSRLVVVHIWAVECKPCVEEMPLLRALIGGLRKFPVVQIAFISETQDLAKLQAFLTARRADLPQTDFFQLDSDALRQPLQNRAQPLTLLLDERGIVRQAFIGSLRARRSELTQAIERFLKVL